MPKTIHAWLLGILKTYGMYAFVRTVQSTIPLGKWRHALVLDVTN